MGVGALYNGIGINAALMNDSDLKYISLGCMSVVYSTNDGTTFNCGGGIGWMKSDILSENNKHGLGLHTGATYNTHKNLNEFEPYFGVSYMYFFKEMTSGGWHLGLTPSISKHDGDTSGLLFLEIGYQI
jgi:hypothetical protein